LNSWKEVISYPNHACAVSRARAGLTITIEEEGIEFGEKV